MMHHPEDSSLSLNPGLKVQGFGFWGFKPKLNKRLGGLELSILHSRATLPMLPPLVDLNYLPFHGFRA